MLWIFSRPLLESRLFANAALTYKLARRSERALERSLCFASEICGRIVTETSVSHAQRGQLGRSLIAVDAVVRTLAG